MFIEFCQLFLNVRLIFTSVMYNMFLCVCCYFYHHCDVLGCYFPSYCSLSLSLSLSKPSTLISMVQQCAWFQSTFQHPLTFILASHLVRRLIPVLECDFLLFLQTQISPMRISFSATRVTNWTDVDRPLHAYLTRPLFFSWFILVSVLRVL